MTFKDTHELKVFISYSCKDKKIVKSFAENLEKNSIEIWFDEWSLHAGENIISSVESGISKSDFLLLMLSDNSLNSGWVDKEWKNKYHLEVKSGNVKVIVIRIHECAVPGFLADKKYVNLWDDTEEKIASKLANDMKTIKEQADLDEIKNYIHECVTNSKHSIYEFPIEDINKRIINLKNRISLRKPEIEVCYSIINSEISAIDKQIENNYNRLSEKLNELNLKKDMLQFDRWCILYLSGCEKEIMKEQDYIIRLKEKTSIGLPNLKTINQITSFLEFIIEDDEDNIPQN